jgi:nifR3 family TIM-barrel protein
VDAIYKSPLNRDVAAAAAEEFRPLPIGPLAVWPPVVLAPMAGVTNYPFRKLCRRYGAGLFVSEMITARALVERNRKTLRLADFGPDEKPRSLQLYGVEPASLGEATRWLVGEGRVDHLDLNFGCPVRKVTAKGGGAAIPAKPRLLARLVRAVVENAGAVPVTMKFRLGIDEDLLTYRDAGRIGEEEGCVAVGLHARTAAQLYDGAARWEAIADLKRRVAIPVLGNGDIWEAQDALRMMRDTGCDGVIVGRACLGRPWLFRDLADVFSGREPRDPPAYGEVLDVLVEHAAEVCAWFGEERGMLMMRKFTTDQDAGRAARGPRRRRPLAPVSARRHARAARQAQRHAEGLVAARLPRPARRRRSPRSGGRGCDERRLAFFSWLPRARRRRGARRTSASSRRRSATPPS